MYEAFAVNVLDSGDQLVSKQEHSFQTESSGAEVEEVLQAWTQQLHHHHVEVALGAAPLDLGDSDATLKNDKTYMEPLSNQIKPNGLFLLSSEALV